MDIDTLVQLVTNRVLEQLETRKKTALVFFTGGKIGFKESVTELKKLSAENWNLKVVLSQSAEKIFSKEDITRELGLESVLVEDGVDSLSDLYKHTSLMVIPTLTMNSLAKISLGLADNLLTNLVTNFIMSNRPIIAAKDACQLDHPYRLKIGNSHVPQPYIQMFDQYMNQVRKFGVQLVQAADLFEAVQGQFNGTESNAYRQPATGSLNNSTKKVITKADVIEAKITGENIRVETNSIITPLALEEADKNNITIVRSGE